MSSKRGDNMDPIDTERILTETFLRHVEWLDQVDSTNDRVLRCEPARETPFLIGAEAQTAGRGRGGNSWWGKPGSLMFSVGVDMPALGLEPGNWPRFSLVTGLAIASTLREFLSEARLGLKWPNDVWLNDRKVCGILIEQSDRTPDQLVVGIGINVNNSFLDAPDDQQRIATTMKDIAQIEFDRTEVLIRFLVQWQQLIEQLSAGRLKLAELWSRACVLTGHAVTVTSGEARATGICTGIDDDGSLLLRTPFALERHYAGTVRRVDEGSM